MTDEVLTPYWYRIEYSSDGKVKSCSRVENVMLDNLHVFYVQALDKSDALLAADHRWKQFLESQRTRLKERRAAHVAAGKCRCGRQIERKGKQCSTCRESSESSHERHAARERGEMVSVPSKAVAFAANKEEQLTAVRLETLLECQRMLLKARNFAVWLESQIQALKRGRR
jgi:hypothetical protein